MTTVRLASGPWIRLLMLPIPVTMPSAGVLRIRSSSLRRLRWAATASAPYSMKLPSSHRSAMFSRAVRWPNAWRLATASGRLASNVNAWRSTTRCRSARRVAGAGSDGGCLGNPSGPAFLIFSAPSQRESVVTRSEIRSNSPSFTVSPAAKRSSVTRPSSVARTSCSIFMASRITSTSPVRTVSPGATNHWTIWACRGERNSVMGEIVGAPPAHTASSG